MFSLLSYLERLVSHGPSSLWLHLHSRVFRLLHCYCQVQVEITNCLRCPQWATCCWELTTPSLPHTVYSSNLDTDTLKLVSNLHITHNISGDDKTKIGRSSIYSEISFVRLIRGSFRRIKLYLLHPYNSFEKKYQNLFFILNSFIHIHVAPYSYFICKYYFHHLITYKIFIYLNYYGYKTFVLRITK